MNYALIRNLLGKIMILIALLMLFPLGIALIYKEAFWNVMAFTIPIAAMAIIGYLFNFKKATDSKILPREGLIIVGVSWLLLSLFGALPFIISQEIPNFFDAFFEISSGFSTTGASILGDAIKVEDLSHSMLLWRSLSHWIGGMGVLVFILAIIPESKDGSSMHILRAESPGPVVGKLVSKMRVTSRILYLIYIVLTLLEFLLLWVGKDPKMDWFSSFVTAIGTAGTGGFAVFSDGLAQYTAYSQYVVAIFMIIFGINFSLFYLILIGSWREAVKNEELHWYLAILFISIVGIMIILLVKNVYSTFEETFRQSLFHVASIVSTTGFAISDYQATWPGMAKCIILILMFLGACAGSTAGGLKISRIITLCKSSLRKIGNMINPRKVKVLYVNGKEMDDSIIEGVEGYFVIYFLVLIGCMLLISVDGFDLITNFSASLSCISNVGPGFGLVGPAGTFAGYSNFSKVVLSLEMIAGRLELIPILALFSPKTWAKRI